jgi:hypothetical protein
MQHLDQKHLAERWLISPRTLEQWRWQGRGLTFRALQCSRAAICSVLVSERAVSAASQLRPRAIAVTSPARASAGIGRGLVG